jgi:RNA-directed DNA polymerase
MAQVVFGFEYSAIKKLLYPHPSYRAFLIEKRNGGTRTIEEPKQRIKLLQQKALEFLNQFTPNERPCVHGFVKERSIVTNAAAHCDRRPTFLLNIDLKDFFPSITFFRVRGLLLAPPFRFSFEVATVFAHLFTHAGKLPQGAPSSPFISNLICRSMDRDLMALAKRHRCTYTRYADDMTFSFSVRSVASLPVNICTYDGGSAAVGAELREIIKLHSFNLNDNKTRISSRHTRQEVTGLTINEFPNVTRKFIDTVRGALHAWNVYGYLAAEQDWQARVKATADKPLKEKIWPRQTRQSKLPKLHNILWGKLLYLRMVRSERDALYNRLAQRYNDLVTSEKASNKEFKAPSLPVHFEVHRKEHVEKAVYVVEWMGDAQIAGRPVGETEAVGAQGTAFAYRRSDMLITCEHVLRCPLENGGMGDVSTAMNAVLMVKNIATGIESKASVVARDINRDLAVLKIDTAGVGMRHFIANTELPSNGMPAHLIGFPNWSAGRNSSEVDTTIITVFAKSGLTKFEIKSMIRKGFSGGPITSGNYGLIGVAQEGATQAEGNNAGLSVEELNKWLEGINLTTSFNANSSDSSTS